MKIFFTKRTIIVLSALAILFLLSSLTDKKKKKMKYNTVVEFKIKEKVEFSDSLTVLLTAFSHKHPFKGGPTKATAYLTLAKGDSTEDIMLSVHGIEGKSGERYDSVLWQEYEFQLKKFHYDNSIQVKVIKKS